MELIGCLLQLLLILLIIWLLPVVEVVEISAAVVAARVDIEQSQQQLFPPLLLMLLPLAVAARVLPLLKFKAHQVLILQ
jgi:hypothetical protein